MNNVPNHYFSGEISSLTLVRALEKAVLILLIKVSLIINQSDTSYIKFRLWDFLLFAIIIKKLKLPMHLSKLLVIY